MYVCPCIIYENDERYQLDATIYLLLLITLSLYPTYTQCTTLHTGSSGPQPQHLVLNTICSIIQRIQPNTPEDGHIDVRNM